MPNLPLARISCDEKQPVVAGFCTFSLQTVRVVLTYLAGASACCSRLSNLYMRENRERDVNVHQLFISNRLKPGGQRKICKQTDGAGHAAKPWPNPFAYPADSPVSGLSMKDQDLPPAPASARQRNGSAHRTLFRLARPHFCLRASVCPTHDPVLILSSVPRARREQVCPRVSLPRTGFYGSFGWRSSAGRASDL